MPIRFTTNHAAIVQRCRPLLIFLILLAPGCSGCTDTPLDQEPDPRDSEKLAEAAREGDVESIREALQDGAEPDMPLAPKFAFSELVHSKTPTRGLKAYLKYQQLLAANVYQLDPSMCSDAAERAKKTGGAVWDKLRKDPKRFLDPKHYSVVSEVTALHLAALFCRREAAKLLLKEGADPNAADWQGLTPLHYATCKEVVELLIEHGAEMNAKSKTGLTPLHVAVDRAIAQRLLDHGADVNARDECGNSPLHFATYFGLGSAEDQPAGGIEQDIAKQVPVPEWLAQLEIGIERLDELMQQLNVTDALRAGGADTTLMNSAGYTPGSLPTPSLDD